MWSTSTLSKLNALKPKDKKMVDSKDVRDARLAEIQDILLEHGLQDTLKNLIMGLEKLMKLRGKSIEALCVLEGLKGLLAGYLRRYEPDEEDR